MSPITKPPKEVSEAFHYFLSHEIPIDSIIEKLRSSFSNPEGQISEEKSRLVIALGEELIPYSIKQSLNRDEFLKHLIEIATVALIYYKTVRACNYRNVFELLDRWKKNSLLIE